MTVMPQGKNGPKKVSEDEKGKNFHPVWEQLAQILAALNSSPALAKGLPGSIKAFLRSPLDIDLLATGCLCRAERML